MLVNEVFQSIQGEGINIGENVIFIRFSGCNQQCTFCDTNHKNGLEISVAKIIDEISKYHSHSIVITGGEPLIQPKVEMTLLLRALKKLGKHITIETNGTIFDPMLDYYVDLWSVSPKLRNSGIDSDIVMILANFLQSKKQVQIKFVVEKEEDIIEVEAYLDGVYDMVKLTNPCIIFQPLYRDIYDNNINGYMDKMKELSTILQGFDYQYRLLPQLHRLAGLK